MPTVLITGGTGLIGKNLTRYLTSMGYHVIILSRQPVAESEINVEYAQWSIEKQTIDEWAVEKADHVICLAGAGIMDRRWTDQYKKTIIESRTKANELIIKYLHSSDNVKSVISASAIGWYGADKRGMNAFTETDKASNDFTGETCRLWEESIAPVTAFNKKLVILRTGIVLSNDGGAYPAFTRPLRFGIAAVLGDGKQVISWIHMDDLCRMYSASIEDENISGIYNAVAPEPVTNKKLVLTAAKKIRGDFFIPVHAPAFALRMTLGQRSSEILKSTTVSSKKILDAGFTFLYPTIESAIDDLRNK